MRTAIAIALLVLCGCASRQPFPPKGVNLVAEEEPPPTADEIRRAQERLTELEVYDGAVDGELGARTRVALARFQRLSGMTPTGRLDRATMQALERASTAPRPVTATGGPPALARPREQAVLPSAARLLADEAEIRAQPPPGALCGALSDAARILDRAREAAADHLQASAPTPAARRERGPGRTAQARTVTGDGGPMPAAGGRVTGGAPAGGGSGAIEPEPAETERVLGGAEQRLADAREEAFETLLDARAEGDWLILPAELALRLEQELAKQSMLLRAPDGRLGPDVAAAIAWLQRSSGLSPTGRPTVRVLEILGIDPAPMFRAGAGCR